MITASLSLAWDWVKFICMTARCFCVHRWNHWSDYPLYHLCFEGKYICTKCDLIW